MAGEGGGSYCFLHQLHSPAAHEHGTGPEILAQCPDARPLRRRRPRLRPQVHPRPHTQPWKWVDCPHSCGYVDKLEIRPSVLYGLVPQLSPYR
ncbi:hypothetical protein OG930_18180 [Streptomyces sp. NBC_01799]|nr:hypothetical protein OG930_18180 [Streptomyces sp. NBC_01799]